MMKVCKNGGAIRKGSGRLFVSSVLVFLLFAFLFSGISKGAAVPAIRVVAPIDKTWVTEKNIFLSGAVSDPNVKQILIKGVKVKAPKGGKVSVKGGAFGAMLVLSKGMNTIKVAAGKATLEIKVYYLPLEDLKKGKSAPKGFKRFYVHKKPAVLDCKECHGFRKGKFNFKRIIPAPSNCTTGKCHSNMGKAPHVHGPVGAGICISCHSPHGSLLPLELERTGQEICLVCHQAKREEFKQKVVHAPVEEGCTDCHDPHQSPMRFQLRGDGKAVSSLCFRCHDQGMFNNEHTHGPVGAGDCIACHRPHSSDHKSLLIDSLDKGKLCFQCHKDRMQEFTMKFVHDPAVEDCGQCHDPHSSPNRFQLLKSGGDLCQMCHGDMNPEVYEDIAKPNKHKPVAGGQCIKCHRPHSSNYQPLLADSMDVMCFKCHVDLGDSVQESKYKHGPVQTGDCTACHKVHGSEYTKLLVRYYPSSFYIDYKPDYYDLCFGCHNKDVAKKKFTAVLTNFRDKDYNLHYFHVHRKKGRTCTACHDPHASNQAKHVRYEVPFGMWSYPIKFTKTATGGTCVVGCHSPKTYDRKRPVGYVK